MSIEISFTLLIILFILFIASTIRSAFGFGDALIAMPLMAFFLDIKTATPLIALIGFSSSLLILIKNWRTAYIKGLWKLILFCVLGIPIGLIFLNSSDEKIVKIVLGFIIILFCFINLFSKNKILLKSNNYYWIFGFLSGILGGAYNTNGPPIIIYGKLKNWDSQNFRAILQSIFLPTNFFILIGQGSIGLINSSVISYFVCSIPLVLIGTYLGGILNIKLSKEKFKKIIDIMLIIIGIVLIINNI